MKKGLTVEEFEKKLAAIPTVKPDEWDLRMLAEIDAEADDSPGVPLEEVHRLRMAKEYSGKISLRVPKSLHRELTQAAKHEGISLNQFILYKLAK
ncbi:MAG: type II toxin-antitoxin system HicB family antitoxin [Oscillospiraceae bacterium]|nr:type II toxin-antitoxin system HicB family antitoxin [Oscillospiraceae bacterium]